MNKTLKDCLKESGDIAFNLDSIGNMLKRDKNGDFVTFETLKYDKPIRVFCKSYESRIQYFNCLDYVVIASVSGQSLILFPLEESSLIMIPREVKG